MKMYIKLNIMIIWAALFLCFFTAASQAGSDGSTTEENQLVSMDFKDVELRQVIRFVSEMTGKNFVVDEKLKGNVTVSTPKAVSIEEAYQIFESILAVHNYKIVKTGNIQKIVVDNAAKAEGFNILPPDKKSITGQDNILSSIFYLKHADANILVPLLKPLLHDWGNILAYIPTNAVIVTDSAATVRKLLEITSQLDVPIEVGSHKFYPLENGSAVQVEKIISSVYADYNSRQPKSRPGVKVFADTRTNSILIMAPPDKIDEVSNMIAKLDKRVVANKGNLHLYYPKNSKAEAIAKVLSGLTGKITPDKQAEPTSSFTHNISVVADPDSNTLIVSATPEDYEIILPIIEGLDIRRLQIHIEALILEISASKNAELGIEWRSPEQVSTLNAITSIGGTNFGTINKATNLDMMNNPLTTTDGLAIGFIKGTIKYGGNEFLNLGALLKAIQTDSDVNVLSTPNILVLDNEQAEIMAGQNVPFQTGSNTGTNTITTIERKDVGLKLEVTPQVQAGGKIKLIVYQEFSSIDNSTTVSGGVVTKKRSVKTTVQLDNGHMVVLGGLIDEKEAETVNMVPCIGSLSIIGELFKNTNRTVEKRNMMVFLRPTIINTYDDLLEISSQKYNDLKDVWHERSTNGSKILPKMPASYPLPEDQNESVKYKPQKDND